MGNLIFILFSNISMLSYTGQHSVWQQRVAKERDKHFKFGETGLQQTQRNTVENYLETLDAKKAKHF